MSQLAASQPTRPVHEPAPVHARLQELPPHAIDPVHEPAPMHWMTQALAAVQSIAAVHEPAPVQVTRQGMPAGQATGPVQVPAAVQATPHVPLGSHVPRPASAHREGHAPEASMPGCRASLASPSLGAPSLAPAASAS